MPVNTPSWIGREFGDGALSGSSVDAPPPPAPLSAGYPEGKFQGENPSARCIGAELAKLSIFPGFPRLSAPSLRRVIPAMARLGAGRTRRGNGVKEEKVGRV